MTKDKNKSKVNTNFYTNKNLWYENEVDRNFALVFYDLLTILKDERIEYNKMIEKIELKFYLSLSLCLSVFLSL